MYKKDVLDFYETPSNVCKALEITPVAFCNWGEVVPKLRAYQIQVKTKNKLKIDESLYTNKKTR